MGLPFTSLTSATSTGPGTSRDLEGLFSRHTMQVHVANGPTSSFDVRMEGSLDGTNWSALPNSTAPDLDSLVTSSTHQVRYVRAKVNSLAGSNTPAVTAIIASQE